LNESLSEEKATAILLANLKGPKKKPTNLLTIAAACRLLIQRWGIKRVSEFFGVSQYQLRQIDKINDLSPEVRELIQKGKLGIEASYQLWRLGEKLQSEVAKEMLGMSAHEIRQLVYLLRKNPSMSVKEAKRLTDKAMQKRISLLVLPLTSDTYRNLRRLAEESHQGIHDLVLRVLEDYIHERTKQ